MKDLKTMEGNIIEALSFDLNRSTALQMLEAMTENNENMTEKAMSLCKFVIENSIFEGVTRKHSPTALVMAALHLCDNVLKCKIEPKLQPSNCKLTLKEVMECFKDMCIALQNGNKFDLSALKRKYAKSKYHQVSKLKITIN